MKRCSKCKQLKRNSEFSKKSARYDGLNCYCRECDKEIYRLKYKGRPKRKYTARKAYLNFKFGVTPKIYNELLASQGGKCKICGSKDVNQGTTKANIFLSIDHDHKTGDIRGLLCNNCNTMLGMAQDEIKVLEAAILYLKECNPVYNVNKLKNLNIQYSLF